MTVRTGFIQRKTFTGILLSVRKDPDAPGDVSQFQALTTALASTIGTGNIIGVGTAIFLGGPGAVFWCWLAGVFGIATKYAESLIAVKYRVRTPDGRMQGGAMYALERGLNLKWLGVLFAALAALASFGIGCGTQINAIAEVIVRTTYPVGIPPVADRRRGRPSHRRGHHRRCPVHRRACVREAGALHGGFLRAGVYHHSGDQLGLPGPRRVCPPFSGWLSPPARRRADW